MHDKSGFNQGLPVLGYNYLQTHLYSLRAVTTRMVTLGIVRGTEICQRQCFTQSGNATWYLVCGYGMYLEKTVFLTLIPLKECFMLKIYLNKT